MRRGAVGSGAAGRGCGRCGDGTCAASRGGAATQAQPAAERRPSQKPDEKITRKEEVTVESASKSESTIVDAPATMTVVTGQTLANSPAQNYADLLRSVPGMNVIQMSARDLNLTTRQGTSTLNNSQLVLVDGRSVYLDFFGLVLWDFVPNPASGDIKQIEVVRGPASVVWGANALTGVINVITKSPREHEGFGATLGAGLFSRKGGSRDGDGSGQQWNGNFSFANAVNETWSYKLTAGYYNSDPYSRPVGTVPLDCHPYGVSPCRDANGNALPGGLPRRRRALPGRQVGARHLGEQRHEPAEGHAALRPGAGAGRRERPHHVRGRLRGHRGDHPHRHRPVRHPERLLHGLRQGRVHEGRAAGRRVRELRRRECARTCSSPTRPPASRSCSASRRRPTTSRSATRTSSAASTSSRTAANYRRNNFDITLAPGAEDRNDFGAYLQEEFYVDKFRVALGGRADKAGNLDHWFFSPRVSVMCKPTPDQSLRASYNRAFRAPSVINNYLDQNIFSPSTVDLRPLAPLAPPALRPLIPQEPFYLIVNNFGNPNLKEEHVDAFELAYTATIGRTSFGLAVYQNDTSNNINFTTLLPDSENPQGLPGLEYYSVQNPAQGVGAVTGQPLTDPLTGNPGLSPFVMAALAQVPPAFGGPVRLPWKVATYLNLGPLRNRGFEASIEHRVNNEWVALGQLLVPGRPEGARRGRRRDPLPDRGGRRPAEEPLQRRGELQRPALPRQRERQLLGQVRSGTTCSTSPYHGYTDAYTLLNATAGIKFADGKAQFSLRGINLLNQEVLQHIYGDLMRISVMAELRFFTR